MIRSPFRYAMILTLLLAAAMPGFGQEEPEEEKAWPRVMEAKTATVTMYEPQLDTWKDNGFNRCPSMCRVAVHTS